MLGLPKDRTPEGPGQAGRRKDGILIADLTGAAVSTRWVSSMVAEAAGLTADSLNLIQALLMLGYIRHADDTTTRISASAAGCT